MARNTKSLIGVIGALLVAGLAAYFWNLRNNSGETYHLANGIEVTAREVPRDDIADALDVRVWKFDMVMPDDKHFCMLSVNQYSHGKFVRHLGGGGFQLNRQAHEVTVSFTPEGADMSRAAQVRCLAKVASGSVCSYFTNPLRDLGGFADGVFVDQPDNKVYLVGGGKQATSPAGHNETDIGIEFKPGAGLPKL